MVAVFYLLSAYSTLANILCNTNKLNVRKFSLFLTLQNFTKFRCCYVFNFTRFLLSSSVLHNLPLIHPNCGLLKISNVACFVSKISICMVFIFLIYLFIMLTLSSSHWKYIFNVLNQFLFIDLPCDPFPIKCY